MRNAVRTDQSLKVILETKQRYSQLMRYDAHEYAEPGPIQDFEMDPIPLPDTGYFEYQNKLLPPVPLFK